MNIGDNIKFFRKQKGLTQKQLAEKIGSTDSAVTRYESNAREPNIETITKIAEALECTVNDLLGLNLTDNKEVREFLYDANQNRLINILKIYGYKVFEEENNFRIVKDTNDKVLSEEQFNNLELFINEYIDFIIGK